MLLLMALIASGAEMNGLRITVQKTLIDRARRTDSFSSWDAVAKKLALKVLAVNTTFRDLPEGTINYAIIVKRWGDRINPYERFTGTEPFPALLASKQAELVLGDVDLIGYESSSDRRTYQDSIEAWEVTVTHGDQVTLTTNSGGSFDRLKARAIDKTEKNR